MAAEVYIAIRDKRASALAGRPINSDAHSPLNKHFLSDPELAKLPLRALTEQHLSKWRKRLPPSLKATSRQRLFSDIKAALNAAGKEHRKSLPPDFLQIVKYGYPSKMSRTSWDRGIDPRRLNVVLTLPSNEAVLAAVRAGVGHAVLSHLVVAPTIEMRALFALPFALPSRPFFGIRQKERYRSKAADALLDTIKGYQAHLDWVI